MHTEETEIEIFTKTEIEPEIEAETQKKGNTMKSIYELNKKRNRNQFANALKLVVFLSASQVAASKSTTTMREARAALTTEGQFGRAIEHTSTATAVKTALTKNHRMFSVRTAKKLRKQTSSTQLAEILI